VALTVLEPRERHQLRSTERLTGGRLEFGRVPTVAALRAKRLGRTRDTLRDLIQGGGLDEFKAVVSELAAEFGPAEVALAAVALAARADRPAGDDAEQDIPDVAPAPYRDRAGGPAGMGRPAPAPRRPRGGPGMARVFVGAGRSAGVGRRELVNAIGNGVGLGPRELGAIDVAERFSLVEVPGELADHVVESLQGLRLNGRQVLVRRDRVAASAR